MENFDKNMALEVIDDALTDLDSQYGRGVATGLCGAFHMCGLLNKKEWESIMQHIDAWQNSNDASEKIH